MCHGERMLVGWQWVRAYMGVTGACRETDPESKLERR